MKFFQKTKIPKNTFRCPKQWDEMDGSDQVRFCEDCKTKVYDLRGLTEAEVVLFIELENGEVCGLAQYDRNGRVINGKCESGQLTKLGKLSNQRKTISEEVEEKLQQTEKRLTGLKELQKLINQIKQS
jgi:hypothetical protein